ncbi:MAG TPA: hypothetical protein VL993_00805, partial [Stellaceae bacterium]|nr:hypothetical protein [Stellaceae bacterium]
DLGEQELKNIALPVRVYSSPPPGAKKADEARDTTASAGESAASPRSSPRPRAERETIGDKTSIAVLPFQNMSGDPEQEHFADGLAEDIITSLSKVHHLLVIARNSTFTYKGRAVDIRQVARELGVGHVLEGSVRRSGDRLRVTAQLIEAASGNHVWAERYDRPLRDVFDVQDEITMEIVQALSVELTASEHMLMFSRSTRNLNAWLEAMQGFEAWLVGSPKGVRESRAHLEKAVAIDPGYAVAWAFIGWCYYAEVRFGFSTDNGAALAKACELSERALAANPDEPHAHGVRAGVWAIAGRFEDAVREAEIAIAGSPNDVWLRCIAGRVLVLAGDAARGVEQMRMAQMLDPFHPPYYYGILANGLEELGQNLEAIEVLTEAVQGAPDYFAGRLRLASLYGLEDRIDEAKMELAAALQINPRFTMAMAEAFYASASPHSTERFKRGLRKAGLAD